MKLLAIYIILVNVAVLKSNVTPCGENEELRCDYQCQKSCENLDLLIRCVSEKVRRCFCINGHVRDGKSGKCIPIDDCPTCAVNQTYKASGIDCQTCTNYQLVDCRIKEEYKCYCLPDYVLDESTGFCKSPLDCPPV